MLTTPHACYVRITPPHGATYAVGPFASAGGIYCRDSAMAWIYRQIGLLKTHFPETPLHKLRWIYRESGFSLQADATEVDIAVSIAGYTLEVGTVEAPAGCPVRAPEHGDLVDELIEPRPITENL